MRRVLKSLLMTNPAYAAQATGFADSPIHLVTVPPDEAGRPGEAVKSYGQPMFPPRITRDGARDDFRVLLGIDGSTLGVVCLGPVAERGAPAEAARFSINAVGLPASPVEPDELLGSDGVRYRIQMSAGKSLTEWKFTYSGWLYAAGVLALSDSSELEMVARGIKVLATWEWIMGSRSRT